MNTFEEVDVSRHLIDGNEISELNVNAAEVLAKSHCHCIFIKIQDYFRKVKFEDVLFLEASGSYCNIYLKDKERFTITRSLAETAEHLHKGPFVRVHRSFVVNLEQVDSYVGNAFCIGTYMVPIGRMYKKEILAGLNILGSV